MVTKLLGAEEAADVEWQVVDDRRERDLLDLRPESSDADDGAASRDAQALGDLARGRHLVALDFERLAGLAAQPDVLEVAVQRDRHPLFDVRRDERAARPLAIDQSLPVQRLE